MHWWLVLVPAVAQAAIETADGLGAQNDAVALVNVQLDNVSLPGVGVEPSLRDPIGGGLLRDGFVITGGWRGEAGCLRLDGWVEAAGESDRIADLVVMVRGVGLALGNAADQPLLLPARLLSRLPLVALTVAGEDRLALAIPPERLCLYSFRSVEGGVELRFPFGFSSAARPGLRMRAPFAVVLYRIDPRWRFRSALERYYRLYPAPFEPFVRQAGGWFFANTPDRLPNPQHFAYYEGGPAGWREAAERGLGTYPYREASSFTVSLPNERLPSSYAEAMLELGRLGSRRTPAPWIAQQVFRLDETSSHGGERCVLADRADGAWTGVLQEVVLDPPVHAPLMVSGWSRAEGVSGEPGPDYSIYVDCTYDDGSYLFGQCATFATGSHDWEEGIWRIEPRRPIAKLRVFCLFRGRQGRAWFDDVRVGPAATPTVNWLQNAGFEELRVSDREIWLRDRVCTNSRGEMVVSITDNFSADVPPERPLNLLRFTMNVDPGLPSTPERPSLADEVMRQYDGYFAAVPELAGCYIDSVSAWCASVYNHRRDHWSAPTVPLSYDPGSFTVAAHGRFAMAAFLGALQARYHPLGKAVFTNIHTALESFPLYLVSDVPGIESSRFADPDSLFFYRAAGYHKPVLLMNYLNLHHLDQPEVAEQFYVNAAQWGLLPSTGRSVEEAYRGHGERIHHWYPAIADLAEAGWEPVPLAEGHRVERFGAGDGVWFTVRDAGADGLRVLPEALAGCGAAPVGYDAVTLRPLATAATVAGMRVEVPANGLVIVRMGSPESTTTWLRGRLEKHLKNAARVRGRASRTPALEAAIAAARDGSLTVAALDALLAERPAGEDLFLLSERREIEAAKASLAALRAAAP